MTEKEKEAIDIIKYNDIARPLACGDVTICNVEDLKVALNLIQRQQEENIKLKQENEKKGKAMNEMLEVIAQCMSENVYDFMYICNKCKGNNEECHGDYCKESIKRYFERKVKNEIK